MKYLCFHLNVAILVMTILYFSSSTAQGDNDFAKKGCTELGGSISFQSLTPIRNGTAGDATYIFSIAPYIGQFVTDGFELGLNPLSITFISSSGGSETQLMISLAPSYNFRLGNSTYPFIEAQFGFTSLSDGSNRGGYIWGGRGGVKLAVTDKCLLNLAIQYIQITTNQPINATGRYGSNQVTTSAGFTVWL